MLHCVLCIDTVNDFWRTVYGFYHLPRCDTFVFHVINNTFTDAFCDYFGYEHYYYCML